MRVLGPAGQSTADRSTVGEIILFEKTKTKKYICTRNNTNSNTVRTTLIHRLTIA